MCCPRGGYGHWGWGWYWGWVWYVRCGSLGCRWDVCGVLGGLGQVSGLCPRTSVWVQEGEVFGTTVCM